MSIYLSYAMDEQGCLHHVDELPTDSTMLCCPFCQCGLIPVKGRRYTHHFRHHGQSCKESLRELPAIPGWNHFHLDYPAEVVDVLNTGYDPTLQNPNRFTDWEVSLDQIPQRLRDELLKFNVFGHGFEFTRVSRIILGSLPLLPFADWMREKLQERIVELNASVDAGAQTAWYQIEAYRQQSLMSATLYLFEYRLDDDSVLHKIGRTRRDVNARLAETIAAINRYHRCRVVSAEVVRSVPYCGYVEKYALHRYREYEFEIGNMTEYLQLDLNALRRVKSDMTKLANGVTPFSKAERFISSGRWRYESKRLAASKRGIEKTLRERGKFGRPKGTGNTPVQLLDKYQDVVDALGAGKSIAQTSRFTGKSASTIKRVKMALKAIARDND